MTAPARAYTQHDLDRLTGWAAHHYPRLWREDPDEVRSAVGWALATGKRIEWVLNGLDRQARPIGRGRHGPGERPKRSPLEEWDGRATTIGQPHSAQGVRHMTEWADPTGELASNRVDAQELLAAAHPDHRQALWSYACGATPTEIAQALGRPVDWAKNLVYARGRNGTRLGARSAAEQRRADILEAVEAGLAQGRSLRAIARELTVPQATVCRLWKQHRHPPTEAAA